jgi:hypothetical protein
VKELSRYKQTLHPINRSFAMLSSLSTFTDVKGTAEACDRKKQQTDASTTGMREPDKSKQKTRGKKLLSLHQSLK